MKFTEEKLEQAFIELLGNENFSRHTGNTLSRALDEVLTEDDLRQYLLSKYAYKQLPSLKLILFFCNLKSYSPAIYTRAIKPLCVGWVMAWF